MAIKHTNLGGKVGGDRSCGAGGAVTGANNARGGQQRGVGGQQGGRITNKRRLHNWTPRIVETLVCLSTLTILPIYVLETSTSLHHRATSRTNVTGSVVSVHHLLQSRHDKNENNNNAAARPVLDGNLTARQQRQIKANGKSGIPSITLEDLVPDTEFVSKPVARGITGRPLIETPAVVGARRAHIACDVNVDSVAYWNDPIGTRDQQWESPFAVVKRPADAAAGGDASSTASYYLSFGPDPGGWNNIRMSLEIVFVLAAATGRTIVLPPREQLFVKHFGKKPHGFGDFFPLHTDKFRRRVNVMTFEEFWNKEGQQGPLAVPWGLHSGVEKAADVCDGGSKFTQDSCRRVYDYLERVGYVAQISFKEHCLVFDEQKYNQETTSQENLDYVSQVCGKRTPFYWNRTFNQQHKLIHFTGRMPYRLIAHYYAMIKFTNATVDHYYKRFVRDAMHYHDAIFCAAGKIVKALQVESARRGDFAAVDEEGAGGYSALHVRRGDLQYKKVKISGQEWYDNTKELWKPNEIIYIATDERDKTFFRPFSDKYEVRFLDDYWELANLSGLEKNTLGMVETIVASRARIFAGTWFSTFSGYINRMRGYHGTTMMNSWYSFLPKKRGVHEWNVISDTRFAFEWPDGWMGIDADVRPTRDVF